MYEFLLRAYKFYGELIGCTFDEFVAELLLDGIIVRAELWKHLRDKLTNFT